ncbi:integral membrane protein [Candidatus Koribacter versatilis Ellin345]|uniref:Integral membrane protein n=1 Tax=Koribacter versatilis (strain Ellin345) TaxID=204669 RepID=Q1IHP3_KORVE|nr:6-pyruvoyl-tetrahydropterin synthase-related protein [Candidatus Koribacter versatilis]ABF43607.1 integral membrane protein [Candidatus Koribacter versatilis Ellin345]
MLSKPSAFPAASRAIPLSAIVLLAIAIHGPLLLMQLPANTYDANTHMFFASHYASHWFSPWNDKWYGGFSQTTYPPLTHQWIALFSHLVGITMAYMLVQGIAIVLLVVGVYRYARLWVSEVQASYAAIGSIFLGSLAMLVYQSGQLPTTTAAALTLNALPYFYWWNRRGRMLSLIKGVALALAAAAAHHVTLMFGAILFAIPVFMLSVMDRNLDNADDEEERSAAGVIVRGVIFGVLMAVGVGIVLYPYLIQLYHNPITQMPIPHGSRDNYILKPMSGMNFWIIPMGALILALPFILLRGATERRLRPLLVGWWLTAMLGLGGTTPLGHWLLGRAFEVLTFERFTFWATLMAMPIVGILVQILLERYARTAVIGLWIAAVATFGSAVSWMVFHPITSSPFKIDSVVSFMNREGHNKFRYLTLGFGHDFAAVARQVDASTVDGDYNSARVLPELTQYGAGQLYNSKYFGASGMEALRAVLKHANQYGLKYIFVRDRYYEPLLAFAGWRQAESYDNGNVTLWTKEDVPPLKRIDFGDLMPTEFQGLMWGILPVGVSLFALFAILMLPERRVIGETVAFPATTPAERVVLREAK